MIQKEKQRDVRSHASEEVVLVLIALTTVRKAENISDPCLAARAWNFSGFSFCI